MEEYRIESSCPRCGSEDLKVYPDGTFTCQSCGFTNRLIRERE